MRLIRYVLLFGLLITPIPIGAQDPAPGRTRMLTRASVHTVELPGIQLDYMDVLWNEIAFEAFENGGAVAFVQRPWFLARLELSRAIRLDDTDLLPGTYALVAHASRDGGETLLEVRQVPPSTTLQRGVLTEAPAGATAYRRNVRWERVANVAARAEIRLEATENGGEIVTLYGNRRMVQPFQLTPGP